MRSVPQKTRLKAEIDFSLSNSQSVVLMGWLGSEGEGVDEHGTSTSILTAPRWISISENGAVIPYRFDR